MLARFLIFVPAATPLRRASPARRYDGNFESLCRRYLGRATGEAAHVPAPAYIRRALMTVNTKHLFIDHDSNSLVIMTRRFVLQNNSSLRPFRLLYDVKVLPQATSDYPNLGKLAYL